MKRLSTLSVLIGSNLVTSVLIFCLMVWLKKKEVQRRDDLIMTVLVGDIATLGLMNDQRLENAKRIVTRNIELVASARSQFSPYGYYGWKDMEKYLRYEGILKTNEK